MATPTDGRSRDGVAWHRLSPERLVAELDTDATRGLDEAEASARLSRLGPNELTEAERKPALRILWEQVASLLVAILVVAAGVSFALGDLADAIAILAIVVLNAALGFSQEYRAERAMHALKRLADPQVRVRREGRPRSVPSREVVPGDVVLLDAGAIVPADCRLIESSALAVDESALTGETMPVEKHARTIDDSDVALADRANMAYSGTHTAGGRGRAVVVATGMATELGRIAHMLQHVPRETTPLQRRLDVMARRLAVIALAIVTIVVGQGLLQGESLRLMFLTGVSLAVAAVPEGLPAVVTIALALGAQRLLRRHALIRKLPAVETLGSVSAICADKTGTLTEHRMTVTALHADDRLVMLEASDATTEPLAGSTALLAASAALCTDAEVDPSTLGEPEPRVTGDPTESALVAAAMARALAKPDLETGLPRVGEVAFDSDRKRMTTVHWVNEVPAALRDAFTAAGLRPGARVSITKGALGQVLPLATARLLGGSIEPLDDAARAAIQSAHDRLAGEGARVLAVAIRGADDSSSDGAGASAEELEHDLIHLGLVAMSDPPRPEVTPAVRRCRTAGIRPIMITGDHPLTARSIAAQTEITDEAADTAVLTGPDLERLDDAALDAAVETTTVYARVAPAHKLRIVEALQRRGHVVAMTGDGVNDAPALKRADIGIAMGITGTDVSKEAADVILRDDNFATIVDAVEEGRVVYDNIRKFIKYLLTTNSGELWVMLLGPLVGMPLPLLPLQILWINLVTDGLPAVALGIEPAEADVMERAPTPAGAELLDRPMLRHMIWVGLLIALLSLGAGATYAVRADPRWQTMVFTTLTYAQLAHVLAIRSSRPTSMRAGLSANPALLGAVALMGVLQLAIIYVPAWQAVFDTRALSPRDLALAVGLSSIVFAAVELEKAWGMRRAARATR